MKWDFVCSLGGFFIILIRISIKPLRLSIITDNVNQLLKTLLLKKYPELIVNNINLDKVFNYNVLKTLKMGG